MVGDSDKNSFSWLLVSVGFIGPLSPRIVIGSVEYLADIRRLLKGGLLLVQSVLLVFS